MSSLLGSLTVLISASTVGFAKAASDIRVIDRATQASTANMATGAKNAGAAMMAMGRTMTQYVSLPLGLLGIIAAKTFSDFEFNLAKVVGLVGIAKDQTAQWGEEMKYLASSIGRGPKELSDALYFVTSAGIRGAEAMDVLETSAKGAAIGLGETKAIADVISSAINAYGKANLSAAQAGDILVNTVKEGKAEADKLVIALGVVFPIASKLKVSFDQVGAGMAAMTRTGTTAATSAVQMRQILFSLLKPSKQAEDAFYAMGTSSAALRKQLKDEGLLSVFMEIKRLIDTFGEERAGEMFPNIRALSGVLDIIGENLEDNKKIFESLADSAGLLDAAFQNVSQTFTFTVQKTMAKGSVMLLEFGEVIARVLIPVFESLGRTFKGVGDWFKELSTSTQNFIITVAGISVIAGPFLVLGSASKAFGGVMKGLAGLTAATAAATATAATATAAATVATEAHTASLMREAVAQQIANVSVTEAAAISVKAGNLAASAQTRAAVAAHNLSVANTEVASTSQIASQSAALASRVQGTATDRITAQTIIYRQAREAATIAEQKASIAKMNAARVSVLQSEAAVKGTAANILNAQSAALQTEANTLANEAAVAGILVKEKEILLSRAANLTIQAQIIAKKAETLATEANTIAKQAEVTATITQQRATILAVEAAAAQAAAMQAEVIATEQAAAAKVRYLASSGPVLLQSEVMLAQHAMYVNAVSAATIAEEKASVAKIAAANASNLQAVATEKATVANLAYANAARIAALSVGMEVAAKRAQIVATEAVIVAKQAEFTASILQAEATLLAAKAAAAQAAATKLQIVATGSLTPKLGFATVAMTAFGKAARWAFAHPLTAIFLLLGAIYLVYKQVTKLTAAQQAQKDILEKTAEAVEGERVQLEHYLFVARNEYVSREQRNQAIQKLNELSPTYLSNLKLETINTDAARSAVDAYNSSAEAKAKVQVAEIVRMEEIDRYQKSIITGENKRLSFLQKAATMPVIVGASFSEYLRPQLEKKNAEKSKQYHNEALARINEELSDRTLIMKAIGDEYEFLGTRIAKVYEDESAYQKAALDKTEGNQKALKEQSNNHQQYTKETISYLQELLMVMGDEEFLIKDKIKTDKKLQELTVQIAAETDEAKRKILQDSYAEQFLMQEEALKKQKAPLVKMIEESKTQMDSLNKLLINPIIHIGVNFDAKKIEDEYNEKIKILESKRVVFNMDISDYNAEKLTLLRQFLEAMIEFNAKSKPEIIPPLKAATLPFDVGGEAFQQVLKMYKDLEAFVNKNPTKIKVNIDLAETRKAFEKDMKILAEGRTLLEMPELEYTTDVLSAYEGQLKNVAVALAEGQKVDETYINGLLDKRKALKDTLVILQQLSDTQENYEKTEEKARQNKEETITALREASAMALAWNMSQQGANQTTSESIDAFEQFKNLLKEIKKSIHLLTPEAKELVKQLDNVTLVKWDIDILLKEMADELKNSTIKAQAFGEVWGNVSVQIGIYERALRKSLSANVLEAGEGALIKYKAEVTRLIAELVKLSPQRLSGEMENMILNGQLAGRSFDYLGGTLQVLTSEFNRLYDLGIRPGNQAMDELMQSIMKLQGVLDFGDTLSGLGSALGQINTALGVSSESWSAWFVNLLNSMPAIIGMFTALTGIKTAENFVTKQKAAATTMDTVATAVNTVVTKANTTALMANAVATGTGAAADAGGAIAGVAKAGSKVPFPLNIIAIAAGVAAVISAFATIPGIKKSAGMAEGGIVPAGYSNDSYPAMLTSGEMVIPPQKLPEFKNVFQQKDQKVVFIIEGRVIKGIMQDAHSVSKAY